ncbi:MAG: hypothetical protein KC442_20995 [Thermomicrobiales bacterium]|nr:hypothetical protein [Thermomicrobiales bacterium]
MSAHPEPVTNDSRRAGPQGPPRRRWRRPVLGVLLGLGAAVMLAGGALHTDDPTSGVVLPVPEQQAVAPQGLATMPDTPVDGVLAMSIPPGASADQQAGGRGYIMPSVIDLNVGDTIVIRNDDDAPHMILYTFLLPGQSDTRTFTEPGSEVYSSGCGLHAASILNFTTIFVHDPASAANRA